MEMPVIPATESNMDRVNPRAAVAGVGSVKAKAPEKQVWPRLATHPHKPRQS